MRKLYHQLIILQWIILFPHLKASQYGIWKGSQVFVITGELTFKLITKCNNFIHEITITVMTWIMPKQDFKG